MKFTGYYLLHVRLWNTWVNLIVRFKIQTTNAKSWKKQAGKTKTYNTKNQTQNQKSNWLHHDHDTPFRKRKTKFKTKKETSNKQKQIRKKKNKHSKKQPNPSKIKSDYFGRHLEQFPPSPPSILCSSKLLPAQRNGSSQHLTY